MTDSNNKAAQDNARSRRPRGESRAALLRRRARSEARPTANGNGNGSSNNRNLLLSEWSGGAQFSPADLGVTNLNNNNTKPDLLKGLPPVVIYPQPLPPLVGTYYEPSGDAAGGAGGRGRRSRREHFQQNRRVTRSKSRSSRLLAMTTSSSGVTSATAPSSSGSNGLLTVWPGKAGIWLPL